jgi:chemotaxis protein CheD
VRLTVGVADMKVSGDADDLLITHALGSCLGLTVHDPVAGVGGLLHVMLPLSTIDADKAHSSPCTFVDTGVPRLFLDCYRLGAVKHRMVVKVAGGAFVQSPANGEDYFQIGKRNIVMLRKLLWRNGVLLAAEDVGGSVSRTLSLQVGTGQVLVRTNGETREL